MHIERKKTKPEIDEFREREGVVALWVEDQRAVAAAAANEDQAIAA